MSNNRSTKTGTQTVKAGVVRTPANLGKVLYQYKPKRIPGITNQKHILYDGKFDGSIDKFTVLRTSSGGWALSLTETEEAWLTKELGLGPNDLNVSDRSNEYLEGITVELPKGGLSLDTSDAWEFLVDKILSAYDNVIAPNSKARNDKRSYRYIRLKDNEENSDFLEGLDEKKAAYKLLGEIEKSRNKMIMVILADKVRLSAKIPTEDLRAMVNKMADTRPSKFLSIVQDPLFTEKGLLTMGTTLKVIELRSGLYYFEEAPLAEEGTVATATNAAHYLADKKNGDIKMAISNKVLDEFNRTK